MDAQKAVDILADHLLGENWYIADPVSGSQANDIIVDEIRSLYKPVDRSPVEKYRRRHKKCKWCAYMRHEGNGLWGVYYELCAAKDKIVNDDLPRPFCSCFKLKMEDLC